MKIPANLQGCEIGLYLRERLPGLERRILKRAVIGALIGGLFGHFGADALGLACAPPEAYFAPSPPTLVDVRDAGPEALR